MCAKRVSDIGLSQMAEFALALDKAGFNSDTVQGIITSPGNEAARKMWVSLTCGDIYCQDQEVSDINWYHVYGKWGMQLDLEKFLAESRFVKSVSDQALWVIPVLDGVTINKIIEVFCRLEVALHFYTKNLDKNVPTNDRDPKNGSYIVRFNKTVEADPGFASKSADALQRLGFKGITLLERLLLGLGYFLTTGQHLDIKNATLCSGSHNSDGGVPGVYWSLDGRGLCVDWFSTDYGLSNIRARVVQE